MSSGEAGRPGLKAIVLSGGGAKGAYEAGLVAGLIAAGEHFDIVCGTSIGAINAAYLAQNDIAGLTRLWQTVSTAQIVRTIAPVDRLRKLFLHVVGSAKGTGFSRLANVLRALGDVRALGPLDRLTTIVGALDETGAQRLLSQALALDAVERILITSATNLTRQTSEVFYRFPPTSDAYRAAEKHFVQQAPAARPYDAAAFAETVRASGAIPAAFAPVALRVLGSNDLWYYVDGGVTNNTPIGQAIDAGADEISIVYVDPDPAADVRPAAHPSSNLAEILLGCFSMMQQRILDLDFQAAQRVNAAVEAGQRSDKRRVRIRAFHPAQALRVGIMGFNDQAALNEAFDAGRMVAARPVAFV